MPITKFMFVAVLQTFLNVWKKWQVVSFESLYICEVSYVVLDLKFCHMPNKYGGRQDCQKSRGPSNLTSVSTTQSPRQGLRVKRKLTWSFLKPTTSPEGGTYEWAIAVKLPLKINHIRLWE
jgi:hypothetical protein